MSLTEIRRTDYNLFNFHLHTREFINEQRTESYIFCLRILYIEEREKKK